jgi:hypothetical protein
VMHSSAYEVVMPRLVRNCALGRGIQYAATYRFKTDFSGILDRPPEPVIGRAFARPVGGR